MDKYCQLLKHKGLELNELNLCVTLWLHNAYFLLFQYERELYLQPPKHSADAGINLLRFSLNGTGIENPIFANNSIDQPQRHPLEIDILDVDGNIAVLVVR